MGDELRASGENVVEDFSAWEGKEKMCFSVHSLSNTILTAVLPIYI